MAYRTSGVLEANNKVDLNSETAGTISHILVSEGDRVGRGQVLMRLRADKQLAQVQQSEAGVQSSRENIDLQQAEISQAQARLDSATQRKNLAQSEWQRYEKLFSEQFISQLELDQKRTNYDTALASWQEAQQALVSSKARYSQATSGLAQARSTYNYNAALARDTVIRAPYGGVVGQKFVDVGDYVAPTEKLITVVDPSLFKMQFDVPERYLERLHIGNVMTAAFEGLGNAAYTGRVNFIDPVVDPQAHTVMVKALLPAEPGLRHGMFGNVALSLGLIKNAVVIPEAAIVPQGEKTFVFVVLREVPKAAGKAKPAPTQPVPVAHIREVVIADRSAGKVQILSGLAAGEEVVTDGLQKVNDGLEVKLKREMPPAAAQPGPAGKEP